MNKIFILSVLALFASCLSEDSADIVAPPTFTRYYSDGYANTAIALEETPDQGFIMLINSRVQDTQAEQPQLKIVLTKTDQYGNEIWSMHYPGINDGATNYAAHSIALLPSGGYLIAGEEIQTPIGGPAKSRLLLLRVDDNGALVGAPKVYPPISNENVVGQAVTVTSSGSFLVLASRPGQPKDILVAEINATTLDTVWTRKYGQGKVNLINRIFYSDGPKQLLYFAGETQQTSSSFDGFVAPSELNAETPLFGITQIIGTNSTNDYKGDFCRKGQMFGYVGYTDANGNQDIVFYQVSNDGTQVLSKIYTSEIFNEAGVDPTANNKNEVANSITATREGGYIVLGTTDTYGDPVPLGKGDTDLLMLKINGLGEKEWSRTYGSEQSDKGNCVRQTSDGGYAVLCTSNFGALETVLLIKTDQNGDVD
jgi:hypothetical protein